MTKPLSKRQQQIYEFIKQEVEKNGYPPTVREIGVALGLTSSSTVASHLAKMVEKGVIVRDPAKSRAIKIHI